MSLADELREEYEDRRRIATPKPPAEPQERGALHEGLSATQWAEKAMYWREQWEAAVRERDRAVEVAALRESPAPVSQREPTFLPQETIRGIPGHLTEKRDREAMTLPASAPSEGPEPDAWIDFGRWRDFHDWSTGKLKESAPKPYREVPLMRSQGEFGDLPVWIGRAPAPERTTGTETIANECEATAKDLRIISRENDTLDAGDCGDTADLLDRAAAALRGTQEASEEVRKQAVEEHLADPDASWNRIGALVERFGTEADQWKWAMVRGDCAEWRQAPRGPTREQVEALLKSGASPYRRGKKAQGYATAIDDVLRLFEPFECTHCGRIYHDTSACDLTTAHQETLERKLYGIIADYGAEVMVHEIVKT